MVRRNFVLIIVYFLFVIINLYNYSNYTLSMLTGFDVEYYFSSIDLNDFDSIDKYCRENECDILINDSDLTIEKYYANENFMNDFNGFFVFDGKVELDKYSKYVLEEDYISMQLKFSDNRFAFEEFLKANNIAYTYNENIMIYNSDDIVNLLYILFIIIILQDTFSNLIGQFKRFSLQIISGYTKKELFVSEVIKIVVHHSLLLILTFLIAFLYFICFKDFQLYIGYVKYFVNNILPLYISFILFLFIVSTVIYKFDFKSFLKKGNSSFALNYLNFILRGLIIIVYVISVSFGVTYLLATIQATSVKDNWEVIKDYNYIVQTYNINKEPSQEEVNKSMKEYYEFIVENSDDSFFITVPQQDYGELLRDNLAIVSSNYLSVTNAGIDVDECGDKCLNVILSREYQVKEEYLKKEMEKYFEERITDEYDLTFNYTDDFSIYSYDLEYNIKNNNFMDNPIVIVENINLMSDEFYYTLSTYFSKSQSIKSDYYAIEMSANKYYELYEDTMSKGVEIFLFTTVILTLYLIIFNIYSTKYYITCNIKKISILRLNGYNSTDIYYGIYSYLIVVYIMLAAIAYFVTKDSEELYLNYYVYVLFVGVVDIIYLTYLVIRIELKEIPSLIKGELL